MTKRTAWFLIVFLGASFSLVFIGAPEVMPPSRLLAQVGVVVGIAPNPYNTLNDQLQQEQTQLNQQAADLAAREAAFASNTASGSASSSASPAVWYLAIAVAIMAVLVILNFYFDWRLLQRISSRPPTPPQD